MNIQEEKMSKEYAMEFAKARMPSRKETEFVTWRMGDKWYKRLHNQGECLLSLYQAESGEFERYALVTGAEVRLVSFLDLTLNDFIEKGFIESEGLCRKMRRGFDLLQSAYPEFDPEDKITVIKLRLQ